MSQKKDSPTERFSFEQELGRIGENKPDSEFSFDDVPLLGGSSDGKHGSSMGKILTPRQDDTPASQGKDGQSPSLFEQMLMDGEKKAQAQHADTSAKGDAQGAQDKGGQGRPKMASLLGSPKAKIIAACAAAALIILAAAGLLCFNILSSKKPESASKGPEPAKGSAQKTPDQLAAEAVAAGDAAAKEQRFEEALKLYSGAAAAQNKPELWAKIGDCQLQLRNEDAAAEAYQKAVDAASADPAVYIVLSRILSAGKKFDAAAPLLEAMQKKFPDNPAVSLAAAEAYLAAGRNPEALANFKKASKQDLKLEQLKAFAALLARESKAEAKGVYLYAAKKFLDGASYRAAAENSDKLHDRIAILTEAATNIKDKDKRTDVLIMLADCLEKADKKDEMRKYLAELDPAAMSNESCETYIKLLIGAKMTASVESEAPKVFQKNKDNTALISRIQDMLMTPEWDETRIKIFLDWLGKDTSDPRAVYLYGRALGVSPTAKEYFEKAVAADPKFPEAWHELGRSCVRERNWKGAEKAFAEWAALNPADEQARHMLAYAQISDGKGEEALAEYEKFLGMTKLSEGQRALKMLPLAQKLPSPAFSGKLLDSLGKDPTLREEFLVQNIRTKLIYGRLSDSDFADVSIDKVREYYIYHMLSGGREKEVLHLAIPPKDFPEFWKVFLCWKNNIDPWKENAEQLIAKYRSSGNLFIPIVASLWLGKIPPEKISDYMGNISPEDEAVLYFIMAVKFHKDKNSPKSKVYFMKSKKDRQNPIYRVSEYYSNYYGL